MASERMWPAVLQTLTADGTAKGVITVESSNGFKVKARVLIGSTTLPTPLNAEIKSIPDAKTIIVGPFDKEMTTVTDVSGYLVVDDAEILQPKQKRPGISLADFTRAVYEEEPVVAIRTIPVGEDGELIDGSVDGIVPAEFDDIKLTRDINTDVSSAAFYYNKKLLWTIVLTRDINTDVIEAKRVDP